MKLLSGANGSVKNNRHFITVHKKISPRIQIDLLKFIKDDGLNFYRCIQLLSMYDKSLDSSFRKEKLKCLDDNCINQTENGCTIFVPKMDIKYPDSEEKKEMISIYSLETKTIDWLKISFQVEKEKAIITNTESEIELITTNSYQQSNNIQEIVNEKYLIKKQLFEQMLIASKLILCGLVKELKKILEDYNEEYKHKLIKYTIRYLLGHISMSSTQINTVNNIIKIICSITNNKCCFPSSYNTCKNSWIMFLNYIKEEIIILNQKCDCFSIMIDETSLFNEVIILLIANFKVKDKYIKKMIKLERFIESSNADNILNKIENYFIEFKFCKHKFRGICCDGASNMKKVCTLLQLKYDSELITIHCLAHRLNLLIQHSFKESNCKFCNVIIDWFSSSNILTLFKDYISNKNIKKPPRNCPTRWQYNIDYINYILDNFNIIEEFLNEQIKNKDSRINVQNIRKNFIEILQKNKISYYINSKNEISIKGNNCENISVLIGLRIIYSETIIAIKLLECNHVFLSNGIRIILSHIKRIFDIKDEFESNNGIIIKEYLVFERIHKSNTSQLLIEFINNYILFFQKLFLNIFITTNENSTSNFSCNNYHQFMLMFINKNIDNAFFRLFLLENKELFDLQSISKELDDEFSINYEKYLEYQVVSPSTSNVESLFFNIQTSLSYQFFR